MNNGGVYMPVCTAYKYNGRYKTIKKDLKNGVLYNFEYENNTDIKNPVIRITKSDELPLDFFWKENIIELPGTANKRKLLYFVDYKNSRNIAKGIWLLSLKLDALTSYQDEILASKANVARSSSSYNLYLNDDFYNALAYPRIGCKEFPFGFSDTYTYLVNVCNTLGSGETSGTEGETNVTNV